MARLFRLTLLGAALAAVVLVTAAADSPGNCVHGVSSVGPAVLVHGHLSRGRSNLTPQTETCLSK